MRRCKSRFVFPKGKVIQNEKLKQTALRETTEEAGVSGELIDYPIIHSVKGNGANSVGKTVCFLPNPGKYRNETMAGALHASTQMGFIDQA